MKRSLIAVIWLSLSLGYAQSAWSAAAEAPKGPATYVGNEVCQACHAPQFEKFSQTQMGKIFLYNARNEAEKRACESCHGPGSNHVAAGSGRGDGRLIIFRKVSGEYAEVNIVVFKGLHQTGAQTY